jgi:hypothetical protein
MGYRSDVGIIVAFDNLDNMKEVLAVYLLDPRVKKYELMQHWNIYEYDTSKDASYMSDAIYYLQLNECDWKWYDSYDDVQGLKYLCELADKFVEEREDFNVGWKEVTIGEDGAISGEESALNNTLQAFCDDMLDYTTPEIYWSSGGSKINITLEKESA